MSPGAAVRRGKGFAMAAKNSRIKKIFAVPHYHYDVEWWKTEAGYNADVAAILDRAVELLDKHPEFTYVIDQALGLRPYWIAKPEVRDKIRKWVAEGRIELVGGTFCSPDENIPTGEALARQYIYGKRFLEDEVGGKVKTAWEIDVFGHPAQFPQILVRAGLDQFVFARGVQNWRDPKAPQHFFLESPDGSRVLCNWFSGHYIGFSPMPEETLTPRTFKHELLNRIEYETPRVQTDFLMFPFGTDFCVPLAKWMPLVREWNEKGADPHIEFSLPERFFDELRGTDLDELPVIKTELNPLLTGCYESREKVKKACRKSQYGILDAEKWAALAWANGLIEYPAGELDTAWENILENDFHDIICGTGTDKVYRATMNRYDIAFNNIDKAGGGARMALAALADTRGAGEPVVAFNSLNRARHELISVPVEMAGEDAETATEFVATGPAGETLACQRAGDELLIGVDLPPVGFGVVNIKQGTPAKAKTPPLSVSGLKMENEFVRVELDRRTGNVVSIFDKKAGCETLGTSKWQGNEIVVEEDAGNLWTVMKTGRTWEGKNYRATVRVAESGPLRACLEARGGHHEMTLVRRVYLTAGSPRVDFETEIDFKGVERRVKVMFAPAWSGKPVFETPFYSQPREPGHWCAQTWADISNGRRGLAVINRGNPGMDAERDSLGLILFRSVSVLGPGYLRYLIKNYADISKASREAADLFKRGLQHSEWALYKHHGIVLREWSSEGCPDEHRGINIPDHLVPFLNFMREADCWERGHHVFAYSVLPHEGDWSAADLPAVGLAFNTPVEVVASPKRNGLLGRRATLFETGADPAAVLVALKKAEKSDRLVARFYDSHGRGAAVKLSAAGLKTVSCKKINATEDDKGKAVRVRPGGVPDKLSPWEIASYALETKKETAANGKKKKK